MSNNRLIVLIGAAGIISNIKVIYSALGHISYIYKPVNSFDVVIYVYVITPYVTKDTSNITKSIINFQLLKRGQPPYKGQNGWSQIVPYSTTVYL